MKRTAAVLLASSLVGAGATALITASPAAATVASCNNDSLSYWASPTQGATGHGSLVLVYRNKSTHTCSLRGYPGVDAESSTFAKLASASRTQHGFAGGSRVGIETVLLAPNARASATVEWMNFNPSTAGACKFSHYILTTAPNTTRAVRFARAVSLCDLQVHPVVYGTSGNAG